MSTAAAACPQPDWPSDYEVALACDRCAGPGGGGGDIIYDDDDDGDGGCMAGRPSSLALGLLFMLVLVRRRRG